MYSVSQCTLPSHWVLCSLLDPRAQKTAYKDPQLPLLKNHLYPLEEELEMTSSTKKPWRYRLPHRDPQCSQRVNGDGHDMPLGPRLWLASHLHYLLSSYNSSPRLAFIIPA